MSHDVKGMKVAILATDGFEQSELAEPKKALEEAGAETVIVSPKDGKIRGWKHTDWGEEVEVDCKLDNAKPEDFEALVLPGGVMNPDRLRMQPKAVEFVSSFFDDNKPVAAICHGPWTIVEAEKVRGRRLTSWPSLKTDIHNAGGEWVDQEMVQDGNLVTSRKPDDLPAFNRGMLKLFSHMRKKSRPEAA